MDHTMTTPKENAPQVQWRGAGRPSMPAELVPVDRIHLNPDNPRKTITGLDELLASIQENGLLQPPLVRQLPIPCPECGSTERHYSMEAGERRFRAMASAYEAIPCVIRPSIKGENVHMRNVITALVENIQREGLNPIERAMAFARLRDEFGLKSASAVARQIGLSVSTVTDTMMLLELAPNIQKEVIAGRVTVAEAKRFVKRQRAAAQARKGKPPRGTRWDPEWFGKDHELYDEAVARCALFGHQERRQLGKHGNKVPGACGQCWQAVTDHAAEARILNRCADEIYKQDPALAGRWRAEAQAT